MEISYRNSRLENLLNTGSELIKKYGKQAAENIVQRMQELDAAPTLSDLPPAIRPHPHEPKKDGKFTVDVLKHKHPLRLLFYAEGEFDLSDKTTIKKIRIDRIIKIHS